MISRQTITLVWCTLLLFSYLLVTLISQSINPNHLLRLFPARILWRQLLASLLFFVQVCCRLIQEDTAAAVVSLCVFPALSCAPRITPFRPRIRCSTTPIFHLPLLHSSPLISIMSSSFKVPSSVLWLRLWSSLRAFRYSVVHLFHRTSLNFRRYLARFGELNLQHWLVLIQEFDLAVQTA